MMMMTLLLLKKSSLNVDSNRKIIKLLHLWPGTFLLLFYFECFDQFWSYSNFYPIKNIADENFMTRMFRRSTVSWSPSENMWNVLLLRILAPPMLARYVTVPCFLIFEVKKKRKMVLNHSTCIWTPKLIMAEMMDFCRRGNTCGTLQNIQRPQFGRGQVASIINSFYHHHHRRPPRYIQSPNPTFCSAAQYCYQQRSSLP